MTEDQIERTAQIKFDALDRRLMARELTQVQYNRQMKEIDAWVRKETRR